MKQKYRALTTVLVLVLGLALQAGAGEPTHVLVANDGGGAEFLLENTNQIADTIAPRHCPPWVNRSIVNVFSRIRTFSSDRVR